MKTFPLPDALDEFMCKYCTALSIVPLTSVPVNPSPELRNGTMTFVSFRGKVYGLTCKHVVDALNKANSKNDTNKYAFFTFANRTLCVVNRFEELPPLDITETKPDLAIREINPNMPTAIGKKPFPIDDNMEFPIDALTHGVAVGFPEEKKYNHEDRIGIRVAEVCTYALAELTPNPSTRFWLYSELPDSPDIYSYSGMSGGPVFWSTKNDYGLLGICYEALPTDNSTPMIKIGVEKITKARFAKWIKLVGDKIHIF